VSIALDIGRAAARLEHRWTDQATTPGAIRRGAHHVVSLGGHHDEVLDPRSAAARHVLDRDDVAVLLPGPSRCAPAAAPR